MNALSIREVAKRLNLRPRTVRQYMKAGILSARKVRRRWFCTETAVEEFLKPGIAGNPSNADRAVQGGQPSI